MFINLIIVERVELLSNRAINSFRNYILNKKGNVKYGDTPRINKAIIQMIGRTVMYLFKRRIKNMINSAISLPPVFAKMFEKILYQYFNIKLQMNFSLFVSLVFFQMIIALCKS